MLCTIGGKFFFVNYACVPHMALNIGSEKHAYHIPPMVHNEANMISVYYMDLSKVYSKPKCNYNIIYINFNLS